MTDTPVHLLWTGGWDSTYRLLDLVLVQGRPVQPLYVIDPNRESWHVEMATMERIRGAAARPCPEARTLILPTRMANRAEIAPNSAITERYQRLKKRAPLGVQYDWLPRLAEEWDLSALELAIHVDDRAAAHLAGSIVRAGDAHVLAPTPQDSDLEIFRRFRFPIFELTKKDIQAASETHGFAAIMEQTWFCFTPDDKGRPCGLCSPCGFAITEGMGRRVPWQGHLRRRTRNWLKRARRLTKSVRRAGRSISR